MIRLSIPLLFALIRIAGFAQISFNKTYGGDGFDRGMYITPTTDTGYIVCGYTMSFGDNYDMYVIKLDPEGNPQWQKNYGGNKREIGWSILELKNGYLLHGSTSVDSTNDDILLFRLDIEGNIVWQKTYGNKKYERTTQLLPTSDNHYLLIGQRNIDQANIDGYIFKIDTAGNLLWEMTFGGPLIERTYYGAETADGDYLITGSILPYKNSKADILLMRLTKNGELKWTRSLGDENVHEVAHSFGIGKDKKKFTLTGYIEAAKAGFHDALFMQLDDNGRVHLQKRYHNGDDLRLMHSEETNDGGFITTGFVRKDVTKELHDVIMLRFNSSGDVQWIKTFGSDDKDDQGYWIVTQADGGFALTGYTHSFGKNGEVWIIKINDSAN